MKLLKSKWFIGFCAVVVISIGVYLLSHHKQTYQFVTVKKGSITESVTLTGNTTPTESVALAFGSTGTIAHTYSALGKNVTAGQVLAELNMTDLLAQLHSAEAGLVIATQNASNSKDNLVNVTAEQNALVASAWQALHGNLVAVSKDIFTTYQAPIISGSYTGAVDGSYTISVYSSNATSGASFNYSGLESGSESVAVNTDVPLGTEGLFIRFPTAVSGGTYAGSTWTVDIPNKRWSGYANALKTYQTSLETRDKVIASAKANIGTTDTSSVSDAEITQAQASIDSATAKIQNAKIVAPISGIITQFDAKVGQLASLNVPLVSIISSNGYEVDAGVSETDIGKISVGDNADMTLDAFPNETFTGKVFYIAPSETNTQGVINYQVKISFNKKDSRLKSGLTANIDIQTKHKDNILILPQYAILQNDQGTFVETLENNKVKQTPVVLGIQDQKGNVEIISGAVEGEQVLNIGLKTQ